jgi:FlaG/FlaF family flagellin (archaellin)
VAYDEHDDVIVEQGGTGVGTILGVILAIVVVLAIVWFFFLGGMGTPNSNPSTDQTQIEIQPPDVNVQPPAEQPPQ